MASEWSSAMPEAWVYTTGTTDPEFRFRLPSWGAVTIAPRLDVEAFPFAVQ
ncbi:MAG: hypothetical protein ABIG71_00715 [Candidatus Uhrbacteria bacterium]